MTKRKGRRARQKKKREKRLQGKQNRTGIYQGVVSAIPFKNVGEKLTASDWRELNQVVKKNNQILNAEQAKINASAKPSEAKLRLEKLRAQSQQLLTEILGAGPKGDEQNLGEGVETAKDNCPAVSAPTTVV